MRYFLLILGLLCIGGIIVLYFQLFVGVVIQVPFFTEWIDIKLFALYLIMLAFVAGIFITSAIKLFMSGSNSIDDDFDL